MRWSGVAGCTGTLRCLPPIRIFHGRLARSAARSDHHGHFAIVGMARSTGTLRWSSLADRHGHFAMFPHGHFAIAVHKSSYTRALCDVIRGHFAMFPHGHFAIQPYSKNPYSLPVVETAILWSCGQPAKQPAAQVRGQCAKSAPATPLPSDLASVHNSTGPAAKKATGLLGP